MEIIEPYAVVRSPGTQEGIICLKMIEHIARVSHRSEDRQTDDSWQRFITSVVLDRGDWSVVEHCTATVEAVVDRGTSHEWVRHRLAAYTQESTRFVNYSKIQHQLKVVVPPFDTQQQYATWSQSVDTALIAYRSLLQQGASPQLARSALPMSLATKIITTANLRSWRHFLLMRTTKETHPQMLQVTIPLLQQFQQVIPLLYDDIVAGAAQRDNLQKAQ